MERLYAERVNTYHYRTPTTRGRMASRRERRVDVVDSVVGPPHICIRLQHRRIAPPPPPPPSPLDGQWLIHCPAVEVIRMWLTSIIPWQCGRDGLSVPRMLLSTKWYMSISVISSNETCVILRSASQARRRAV